jgi:hypothetical protein
MVIENVLGKCQYFKWFSSEWDCPMIAQTLTFLLGSRARLSGIVAALAILVIILFGAPMVNCYHSCFGRSDDNGGDRYI